MCLSSKSASSSTNSVIIHSEMLITEFVKKWAGVDASVSAQCERDIRAVISMQFSDAPPARLVGRQDKVIRATARLLAQYVRYRLG